jgi:hypothetical protein
MAIKATERGIRAVFIGIPENQKGYLMYVPSTRAIMVSGDIIFDESFRSTLSTPWHQYKGSQPLCPADDFIPNVTTTVESTGTIQDLMQPVEEGNNSKIDRKFENLKIDDDDDNLS